MKADLANLTARRSTPARSANNKQEIQTLELPLFFATAKLTCSMHRAFAVKKMNLLFSMAATDLGASERLRPLAPPSFFSTSPVGIGDGRAHLFLRGLTFELTGAEQIGGIWARLF